MSTQSHQPPNQSADYQRWLRNAYEYYHGDGHINMSDAEWDMWARVFASRPNDFAELKGKDYTGGSLFWLKKDEYPEWAKEPL